MKLASISTSFGSNLGCTRRIRRVATGKAGPAVRQGETGCLRCRRTGAAIIVCPSAISDALSPSLHLPLLGSSLLFCYLMAGRGWGGAEFLWCFRCLFPTFFSWARPGPLREFYQGVQSFFWARLQRGRGERAEEGGDE